MAELLETIVEADKNDVKFRYEYLDEPDESDIKNLVEPNSDFIQYLIKNKYLEGQKNIILRVEKPKQTERQTYELTILYHKQQFSMFNVQPDPYHN